MTRLFLENLPEGTCTITLDKKRGHYIRDVLRCRTGDEITVFDGRGNEFLCTVGRSGEAVVLNVKSVHYMNVRPLKRIVLVQGLLKGQKMDLVVQKATEMGVSAVIPVITMRSQVRHTARAPRWRKIAVEASRQCGRTDVPEVVDPVPLDEYIDSLNLSDHTVAKIVFYEDADGEGGRIESLVRKAREVVICVGTEGGFDQSEVDMLTARGFHVAGLGRFVLRAETASLVALGIVQYLSGHFG